VFVNKYLGGQYYRPITNLTFLFDIFLGGGNPFFFHLTNLVLHALVSVIVYRFLIALETEMEISFFLSLVYAVHPIFVNAVDWIVGRGDILSVLFVLLAFIFIFKYIKYQKIIYAVVFVILALLAILSKEAAVMLPFVLSIYLIWNKKLKKNISVYIISFIPLCIYVILRVLISGKVNPEKIYLPGAINNIALPFEFLSKLFFPLGLKVLPDYNIWITLSGILVLIVILFLPLKLKRIIPARYFFGVLWFFVFLAPSLPINTMAFGGFQYWDCRAYLPSIGIFIVLSELMKYFPVRKYLKASLILVTFLAVITILQSMKYKNEITFWESAVKDQPNRALFYERLAFMYYQNGMYEKSLSTINKALKMETNDYSIKQKADELIEMIRLKKSK